MPELLAPAGSPEKLVSAIHYGADAVYLGGKQLSLRANAGNFSMEEMADGVAFAHERGKKVYATVNVLAHNSDFADLDTYLDRLRRCGVDGVIVSDPGVLSVARRVIAEIPLHLSTQANVTNAAAAQFWLQQGVKRLNVARELSLEEISTIRQQVDGEIEVFVHGALCISYSGRCMLSSYLNNRDANQGNCAHPCRYSYSLVEEKRPGRYFPVEEDERGTYIFNAKDLCLLGMLPRLIAAGVDSLKIEGRMKSIFYVGGVVRVYRAALDYLAGLPAKDWRKPEEIVMPAHFFEEIEKTGTRGMSENFFNQPPTGRDMLYTTSRADQRIEPVAVVREPGELPLVEIRNRVELDEQLEYMGRGVVLQAVRITGMITEKDTSLRAANPGNNVFLQTAPPLRECERHGILRRKKT
ncbi:MAG: U32 family peptidase [Desulfopila sp.]